MMTRSFFVAAGLASNGPRSSVARTRRRPTRSTVRARIAGTSFSYLELLTALARSSTRGEARVVRGACHEIQERRPQAVVTAVDDVLGRISR